MAEMDIRREILSATIQVFNKKGIKFTMDDVAKEVGISNHIHSVCGQTGAGI